MKEKRNYERPSMKVFELKHRSQLLQMSGGGEQSRSASNELQDYGWHTVTEE
jgi:hypothetical protein